MAASKTFGTFSPNLDAKDYIIRKKTINSCKSICNNSNAEIDDMFSPTHTHTPMNPPNP